MREITEIIIHCSDTPSHMDIGVQEIRQWHTMKPPKGNGWQDIGYHLVVRRDGEVEYGRPYSVVGAHCSGHNAKSIGVCLVGGQDKESTEENNFTKLQFSTLLIILQELQKEFPQAEVYGHRDFNKGKQCPCFDVHEFIEENK